MTPRCSRQLFGLPVSPPGEIRALGLATSQLTGARRPSRAVTGRERIGHAGFDTEPSHSETFGA